MMSKTKAAQSERDRLSTLLSEYAGDVVVNQSDRAVKSRKDLLWSLPEINENGINILTCYGSGKLCFEQILAQDVRQSEPRVSVGRRKRNIAYYTLWR